MNFFHINNGLVPTCCCVCQTIGHYQPNNLCRTCRATLTCPTYQCSRCALPLAEPNPRCGVCLKQPPLFDSAFSAFLYQPPVSLLVQKLKQGVDQTSAPFLTEIFCEQVKFLNSWQEHQPTAILPIPLHWRRYLQRGYNQSRELAQLIGQKLALPVSTNVLKRVRHSSPQQGMARSARLQNPSSAFTAIRPKTEGKAFIILDDVMTTGATMNAAATALKLAGATSVIAWSLARTPKP